MSVISESLSSRQLSASPPGTQTAADLPKAGHGVVVGIHSDTAPQIARRLLDLGFVPGAPIERLRRAPLGDPTVYRVGGIEIALRRRDARLVQVTL